MALSHHPIEQHTPRADLLDAQLRNRIVAAWRDADHHDDPALARAQLLREIIEALADEVAHGQHSAQERATLAGLSELALEHAGVLAVSLARTTAAP